LGKLRIGVVGIGYLGSFHAEKYAAMDHVALVGIVDTDKDRVDEVARRLGTEAFFHHTDLMGKVDAVSVVVPTPEHFDISRDFLVNDVDVLVEKPMTVTLEEADQLIAVAESRGRIIQVGHLERFNPAVMALQEFLKEPRFIESHRLSIYKERCNDVSVVLDLMIHDIDIILNLVKSDVTHIQAAGIPVVSGHVDIANARLTFQNGCVANVTASRISTKNERKIRLFQRDAYISVDFANHDITLVQKQEDTCSEDGSRKETVYPRNGSQLPELIPGMKINQFSFSKGDALAEEIRSFVSAVNHRLEPAVTGRMGRDALKVALEIMDQIRSSQNPGFDR